MFNPKQCKRLTAIVTGLSAASVPLNAIEPGDLLVYSKEPFFLRPQFGISETYSDNVFSRAAAKDDFVTTLSPGLNLQIGKGYRNFVAFDYTLNQRFYGKLDHLNAGEHSFALGGRLQGQRLVLLGNDSLSLLSSPMGIVQEERPPSVPRQPATPVPTEGAAPPTAPAAPPPTDPASPIRGGEVLTSFEERNVDQTAHYHSYNLGYRISEKTAAYIQGQYSSTDYEEGVGYYDINTWRGTAGFAFQGFPKTSFFGEVYYGQTETTPNFTAPSVPELSFVGGFLGARGNFTEKLSGIVKVGYETREFDDGAGAPSSPVVDLSLTHRLTQKMSAYLSFARLHDVSVQFAKESYTANVISGGLSQLIGSAGKWRASASGRYGMFDYETTDTSVERSYDHIAAYFSLEYQIQVWLIARLGYSFDSIKSGTAGMEEYDVNRVTLGLSVGY